MLTEFISACHATRRGIRESTRSHLINGEAQKIAASIPSNLSSVALAKGEARDLLAAFSHGVRKGELNSPLMRNRCISRWCLTIL